jgi:tetratricopeptide (TPR) repeat protein
MTTFAFRRNAALLALLGLLAAPALAQQEKPHCRYGRVARVPIRYVDDVLTLMPAIDATINGSPAVMILNTGYPSEYLTYAGAAKRKLKLRGSDLYLTSAAGKSTLYMADLDEMSAGTAHAGVTSIPVLSKASSSGSYDGILGAPFLLQFDLELNLANKEFSFFKPTGQGCEHAFLAYWDRNAIVLDAERTEKDGPNPRFDVELNGVKMSAMIISAAHNTSITLDAARRAGMKPDAPGVTALPSLPFARHASHWTAPFERLTIGTETIKAPVLEVRKAHALGDPDIQFGADFLRAHRVLFAQSQRKLYLSAVAGQVFGDTDGIEPWEQREIDAGNPHAEMLQARRYEIGGAKDSASAREWLEKAAAHGLPQAQLQLGHDLMQSQHYKEAAEQLQRALAQLPPERLAALWLYLSRMQAGDAELGRRELEQYFPAQQEATGMAKILARLGDEEERPWPTPIADFYLNRIDAAALLAQAAKDDTRATARTCEAKSYMAEWRKARGEHEAAEALLKEVQTASCAPTTAAPGS